MNFSKLKSPLILVLVVILITLVARIIVAAFTGLGIGESYYFKGAKSLQLSYFDQPPLFFWLGGLSIKLIGSTNLAIRLPSILLFSGSTWLVYLIGKKLFNAWAGFYSVLILNLSLVFTIPVAIWFQPDAPLIFFWLLTAYLLILIFFDQNILAQSYNSRKTYRLWILTGISMGLTILSKYHGIFLVIGTFIFVVIHKNQRHWLKHPGTYIALVISLLFVIPVVLWNSENNWVSFVFQGSRAGDSYFRFDRLLRSIIGQAIWLAPWIWYPMIKQLFVSFRLGKTNNVYSFCFWTAVLPIVFFTIIALWTNIQYHFHWQAPGYLMLLFPLGAYVYHKISEKPAAKKNIMRWIYFSAGSTIVTSFLILFQCNTGFLENHGPKWISENLIQGNDPTLEGFDYKAINHRFKEEGWEKDSNLFVGSMHWWEAGKIDWALRGGKKLLVFHGDPRNHAYFINPRELLGQNAIIVTHNESLIEKNVSPFFSSVQRLTDIKIARNKVEELYLKVFYCKNFRLPETPVKIPIYRQLEGLHPY